MFADSLCDSPWAVRSRRGWTTLASFAVQTLVVGSLLLFPLLYTAGLPQLQSTAALVAPAPPPAPLNPVVRARATTPAASNLSSDNRLIPPHSIPSTIAHVVETVAPPPVDFNETGVSGSTGGPGARNGVWNSIGSGLNAVAPPPTAVAVKPRISVMMEANLIQRVQPEYPAIARMAHIQGTVILQAVISKQGTIENLQVVSGPPLLVRAAKDAVRQWRYRPYYLNGEPMEVDTQVTVNFILSGG